MKGIVKWFNPEKGFGFVECEGKDYFAHFSEIVGTGYRSLCSGQTVTFSPGASQKGNIAMTIVPQFDDGEVLDKDAQVVKS